MKRTAESIIAEMEAAGAMTTPKMTSRERREGLLDYQDIVLKEVFNDEHAQKLRISDAAAHFKELAKEKGIEDSDVVKEAIRDMDMIAKEISIAISGDNGERAVARTVKYAERNIIRKQCINLSDEENKTELDQIVITSNGILILEVKNYKTDITISESGCIYGPCNRPYSSKILGEQMNVKRYLLRTKLAKALIDIKSDIPIHIDSIVVFSDSNIAVNDLYKLETYCFNSTLPHQIENFTSDICYTEEQMKIISEIIDRIAEDDEEHEVGMDFDRIRKTFAQALVLLESEPVLDQKHVHKNEDEQEPNQTQPLIQNSEEPADIDSFAKRTLVKVSHVIENVVDSKVAMTSAAVALTGIIAVSVGKFFKK